MIPRRHRPAARGARPRRRGVGQATPRKRCPVVVRSRATKAARAGRPPEAKARPSSGDEVALHDEEASTRPRRAVRRGSAARFVRRALKSRVPSCVDLRREDVALGVLEQQAGVLGRALGLDEALRPAQAVPRVQHLLAAEGERLERRRWLEVSRARPRGRRSRRATPRARRRRAAGARPARPARRGGLEAVETLERILERRAAAAAPPRAAPRWRAYTASHGERQRHRPASPRRRRRGPPAAGSGREGRPPRARDARRRDRATGSPVKTSRQSAPTSGPTSGRLAGPQRRTTTSRGLTRRRRAGRPGRRRGVARGGAATVRGASVERRRDRAPAGREAALVERRHRTPAQVLEVGDREKEALGDEELELLEPVGRAAQRPERVASPPLVERGGARGGERRGGDDGDAQLGAPLHRRHRPSRRRARRRAPPAGPPRRPDTCAAAPGGGRGVRRRGRARARRRTPR